MCCNYTPEYPCIVTWMLRIAIDPPVLQAAALSPVQTVEADASVHLIKASNVMPKGICRLTVYNWVFP